MVKLLRGDSKNLSYNIHRHKRYKVLGPSRILDQWTCRAGNTEETKKYHAYIKGFEVTATNDKNKQETYKETAYNNALSKHTQNHIIAVSAVNYTKYFLFHGEHPMIMYVAITGVKSNPPDLLSGPY